MNNIEIKIWANPQGIIEGTRQLPSIIFTEEEKNAFNPDGYSQINTQDFFSIFYARDSYVVNYHFLVTSKLDFRHKRTIISVAIPRGYSLGTPIDSMQIDSDGQTNIVMVLGELKRKYEDLLIGLDINDLTNALTRAVPEWISEYSTKLVVDGLQPFINIPGTTRAKGYVLYDSSIVLQQFLEAPVRMEFNGASMMLLLPYGAELQNAAFLNSFLLVKAEPKYRPKFSVYLPAYQREPIAIIYSLDESIEQEFSKPYCKPIRLNGKYSDNFKEWNIHRTSDNAGYNIGLNFEEEEFRYKINVTFTNLYNQKDKVKNVDSWLVSSVGRIVSDNDDYALVLMGAQQELLSQITFTSNRKDYQITQGTFSQERINVSVEEVFYYDIQGLKSTIEFKYHFSPTVYLSDGKRWISYDRSMSLKGEKCQYKLKIAESEEYMETEFSMAQDINQIVCKRKAGIQFTIVFVGDIRRWLKADDKRTVTLQEEFLAEEHRKKDNIPMGIEVNLSNNMLELPPFSGKKQFSFKAPGFKTEYKMLNNKIMEIELNMHVVWWKKLLKTPITYMIACMLIGYLLGCCWHPHYFDKPTVIGLKDTIAVDTSIVWKDNVEDSSSEPKDSDSIILNTSSNGPSTTVSNNQNKELNDLIEKLRGINYTHVDLAQAKNLAKKIRQNENDKKFFDGCEFALSVATVNTNRSADYVKNQLPRHTTLSKVQKDAINKIIEDIDVYNSDNQTYPTIKAMLENYNN